MRIDLNKLSANGFEVEFDNDIITIYPNNPLRLDLSQVLNQLQHSGLEEWQTETVLEQMQLSLHQFQIWNAIKEDNR